MSCEINELDTREPSIARAVVDMGGFIYEGGVKDYKEWAKAIRAEAGSRVSEAALQSAWVEVKLEARGDAPVKNTIPKPTMFTEELAKRLGLEGASKFLEAIQDASGEPVILQKLIDETALTPAEKQQVADAWGAASPRRGRPALPSASMSAVSQIVADADPVGQLRKQEREARQAAVKATKDAEKQKAIAEATAKKAEAEAAAKQKREESARRREAERAQKALEHKQRVESARKAREARQADARRQKSEAADAARFAGAQQRQNARQQARGDRQRTKAANATQNRIDTAQRRADERFAGLPGIAGMDLTPREKKALGDVAVEEYAKRAQSASMWAKNVERRTGVSLDEATRRKLYEMAAGEFARQDVPVEAAKRRMTAMVEKEVLRTKPVAVQAARFLLDLSGTARSIITSIDYSGWINQGGILTIARPKLSAGREGALAQMFKAGASEDTYQAINGAILARQASRYGSDTFFKDIGLELSEVGDDAKLTAREEGFAKGFAEKIPGVKGSERAYTTVLNVLRADTFDAMYEPGMSLAEAKDIARYINVASGRGDVLESFAPTFSAAAHAIFSPRYFVSRVQYLIGEPYWMASSARTRKLVAKEYARYLYKIAAYVGLGLLSGLIKRDLPEKDADGKKLNPVERIIYGMTSSDAGVMRIPAAGTGGGELNLDPYSSLKQYLVLAATLKTGQKVPSDKQPLNEDQKGEGMYKVSAGETMAKFARSKLAPVPSQLWTWGLPDKNGEKTDYIGRPASAVDTARNLLLPMGLNEVIHGFQEIGVSPPEANKLMIALGVVGSAGLSAFGLRASYRNRNNEQKQREQFKGERKDRKTQQRRLDYARSLSPEDLAKPENALYASLLRK